MVKCLRPLREESSVFCLVTVSLLQYFDILNTAVNYCHGSDHS